MLFFQEMAIHRYQEEMAKRYQKNRMKNQNHMNPSHIMWCQIGEILELTLLPENRLVHLHTCIGTNIGLKDLQIVEIRRTLLDFDK